MRPRIVIAGAAALVAVGWLVIQQRDDSSGDGTASLGPAVAESGADLGSRNRVGGSGGRVYVIDAALSEVYWRIYKAGAAARFGHNHVISIGPMEGSVALGDDPAEAEWQLRFPVTGLIIDDPEIRSRYGEDFESVPSEDDKAGTKQNMLRDSVLNGDVYPEIRLSGTGFSGSLEDAQLPVTIEILGRALDQTFPASVSVQGERLTVTGEKAITHADLGMEPFSILGGIIAVGEAIDLTYRIEAIASD